MITAAEGCDQFSDARTAGRRMLIEVAAFWPAELVTRFGSGRLVHGVH